MSQNDLLDAYKSIYTNDSLTEETIKARTMNSASRKAAAERISALQKDPKNNPYAKKKPAEKPLKFGKYTDAWNADPRADAEFEKMNKTQHEYHPKAAKDIAGQYKATYGRTASTDTTPTPTKSTGQHNGRFGRYVDAAVKSLTREELELVTTYLVDEGYALCENTACIMCAHMSDEWVEFALNEMRKQDKMAGRKSGGVADPAYREVKNMMRDMQGKPEGQQKKVPGKKPPRAGEYRSERQSPKTIVDRNRARRIEGERNMSSRFD